MDKTQAFIRDNLFSRSFDNPNKPIDEKRLQETLLIAPTDGGLSYKVRKQQKSKSSLNLGTLHNTVNKNENYLKKNYKDINKNSKIALKEYINRSKKTVKLVKGLIKENDITSKEQLIDFIKNNNNLDDKIIENIPNYDKLLPMYENLWLNYMKEILNIPNTIKDDNINKFKVTGGQNSLIKLSMADYNGALLKVVTSKNKNLSGTEGIVLWDSQKNFIMITKGKIVDEIKIIPKKGTIFGFEVPITDTYNLTYSIIGDRFKYRSSDRSGRKFKSRRCDDMLYYLNWK